MSQPVPAAAADPTQPRAAVSPPPRRLATPLEARALLPFAPHLTSDGLGWPGGAVAELYRGLPPGRLARPAEACHRLVLLWAAGPGVAGAWQYGGRRHAAAELGGPGRSHVCVVSAGRASEWEWGGGRVDLFTLAVPPALLPAASGGAGLLDRHDCRDEALSCLAAALRAELAAPGDAGAGGALAGLALRAVCVRLAACHAAAAGAARPPRRRPTRLPAGEVERARERMRAGLEGTAPTVAELAAAARLSEAHFRRGFKAATGETPRACQLRLRAARAAELIGGRGDLGLAEVAARLGYCDQGYMGRRVRRLLGATPAALRRAAARSAAAASSSLQMLLVTLVAAGAPDWADLLL